jgi:hypothetical protein
VVRRVEFTDEEEREDWGRCGHEHGRLVSTTPRTISRLRQSNSYTRLTAPAVLHL